MWEPHVVTLIWYDAGDAEFLGTSWGFHFLTATLANKYQANWPSVQDCLNSSKLTCGVKLQDSRAYRQWEKSITCIFLQAWLLYICHRSGTCDLYVQSPVSIVSNSVTSTANLWLSIWNYVCLLFSFAASRDELQSRKVKLDYEEVGTCHKDALNIWDKKLLNCRAKIRCDMEDIHSTLKDGNVWVQNT